MIKGKLLSNTNHYMMKLCKAGFSQSCYDFPCLSQQTQMMSGSWENQLFWGRKWCSWSPARPGIILNTVGETRSNLSCCAFSLLDFKGFRGKLTELFWEQNNNLPPPGTSLNHSSTIASIPAHTRWEKSFPVLPWGLGASHHPEHVHRARLLHHSTSILTRSWHSPARTSLYLGRDWAARLGWEWNNTGLVGSEGIHYLCPRGMGEKFIRNFGQSDSEVFWLQVYKWALLNLPLHHSCPGLLTQGSTLWIQVAEFFLPPHFTRITHLFLP